MNEMGLDHLRLPNSDFQMNEGFLKRLEDLQQGIFESPHLSPGFARELKYGFGGAFGHRLVDWVWESLEPSFKSSVPSMSTPDLSFEVPLEERARYSKIFQELSASILKKTGVHLPKIVFKDGEKVKLFHRSQELVTYEISQPDNFLVPAVERQLLKIIWRLLTVDQVKRRLQGLFHDRPDLAAVFYEESLGVVRVVRILRDILKDGFPILEFDLIIETILEQKDQDNSTDLSERVRDALEPLLAKTKFYREKPPERRVRPTTQKELEELAQIDEVCIEAGRGLLDLVDSRSGAPLLERISSIRKSVAKASGWVPPGIRFRDNLNLDLYEFTISVRGLEVVRGEVHPNLLMAMGPTNKVKDIRGMKGRDPAFGNPVVWIDEELKDEVEQAGCVTFTAVTAMAMALTQALHTHADVLYTHQAFKESLDELRDKQDVLVDLVTDDQKLFLKAKNVLCRLLGEGVPILDKLTVLETLLEQPELPVWKASELVRKRMPALICRDIVPEHKRLVAMRLAPELESLLLESLEESEYTGEPELNLGEETLEALQREVCKKSAHYDEEGIATVFFLHPKLRRPFRDICHQLKPGLTFLTRGELTNEVELAKGTQIQISQTTARQHKTPASERTFFRARKWRRPSQS